MPSWQRVRDLSCSALLAGGGALVVTGRPGTGRSTLMQSAAHLLRSAQWTVEAFTARLPPEERLAALTGRAAIMIDDADRLTTADLRTLERLRQCPVLLLGDAGLEKRVPTDNRFALAPLPAEEVAIYARAWLEREGRKAVAVTPPALARLADVSAGNLRTLSALMPDAVRGLDGGAGPIEVDHVDFAAWCQMEQTAARRLSEAATEPTAPAKRADVSFSDMGWLQTAPFAPTTAADRPRSVWKRVLVVGLAAGVVGVAAGSAAATSGRWLPPLLAAIDPLVALVREAKSPAPVARHVSMASSSAPTSVIIAEAAPLAKAESAPTPPAPSPAPVQFVPPRAAADDAAKPATRPDALPRDIVNLLNERGQQMLALQDYSAARSLFTRAAQSGDVRAMVELGRSYDPNVVGMRSPVAELSASMAAEWYRRAASLGSEEAATLLERLERSPL